eukprot:gene2267-2569_t
MYFVVCIIFGFFVYLCINLIITKPFDDFNTVKDEFAQPDADAHLHNYLPESIPPLEDIPMDVVNRLLYQTKTYTYVAAGANSQHLLPIPLLNSADERQ